MLGSATTPGRTGTCEGAPAHVAFRVVERVGTAPEEILCLRGSMAGLCMPLIRANADARLGVDVERYSFIRVDLHRLLFASFTGAPTIKLRVLILIFAL